jgi:hypothetical protein
MESWHTKSCDAWSITKHGLRNCEKGGGWKQELNMEEGRRSKIYITKQIEYFYQVQDLYISKNMIDALNFDLRSKFIFDDLFE